MIFINLEWQYKNIYYEVLCKKDNEESDILNLIKRFSKTSGFSESNNTTNIISSHVMS
ncbi:hypothetical protein PIROE2DRAFT_12904 [Piromyces sp. E2]|nr:hypothetical protein PIROE2DRAFT_12904 [Piromyces sp. E2]|eukprot:OUM61148.1 hypothetical protein PIROE2DRAFT_12904 [Piromyces sp. E2]